jgi:hypothetical protein
MALSKSKLQSTRQAGEVRSVGIPPAVITAAVLPPAMTAAVAFRPPAGVSRIEIATSRAAVVACAVVSVLAVAATALMAATSASITLAAAAGSTAPRPAFAAAPLSPILASHRPVEPSLVFAASELYKCNFDVMHSHPCFAGDSAQATSAQQAAHPRGQYTRLGETFHLRP